MLDPVGECAGGNAAHGGVLPLPSGLVGAPPRPRIALIQILPNAIPEMLLLVPHVHGDARGFFVETAHHGGCHCGSDHRLLFAVFSAVTQQVGATASGGSTMINPIQTGYVPCLSGLSQQTQDRLLAVLTAQPP